MRPLDPVPRDLAAVVAGLPALPAVAPDRGVEGLLVTGATHDSRQVQPGDVYAALPGSSVHGASYAAQAVAAGAVAILTDPEGAALAGELGIPYLLTDWARGALGAFAAEVHGRPADRLLTFGVTGTNGKTTTAFLLEAGLRAAGHTTGLIGTIETRIADAVVDSVRTTPEATDLQALLALMVQRGVTAVAMEVSSHALVMGRVDGFAYDAVAFTNLTQDHLDYHGDMASYEAAKATLFRPDHARRAVVNVDDPAGRRLLERPTVPTTSFGVAGDWRAAEVVASPAGSSFRLLGPGVDRPAEVRLPGAFNVSNALAALAALITAGADPDAAVAGVAALRGVPGRMERIDEGQPFLALVDYAHTPDAVTTVLRAVRGVTDGALIVVLGCGGDRDRSKRPLMGAAAVGGADVVILTSDNPRSEDPEQILAEMAVGAPGALREVDRRAAIRRAVELARPGDSVVIAGKGHEPGQEAHGVVLPFDDRDVLRSELLGVVA
jgi:UDP-N-acetylmuramoyl-L-alanyl-D-glutamate--2,6-diaminopimelate ligase